MDLQITLAKITMLKEDIINLEGMLKEKRERLADLEEKFVKLQNVKA